jgi:hypothetical protein
MATANPLPEPAWTDGPIDDAFLAQLPPDVRAGLERADERFVHGAAQIVWQEDVPAVLAELQRSKTG